MDATHLHLLLNHFPIIGTVLGVGVMIYGYITSSDQVKKAALWTWFVMALIAIPVFLTGEPAEESVEGIAGVSEALIEEHEEAAELAIWLMEALGLLSLVTLVLSKTKDSLSKPLVLVSTVLGLVVFGAMARTGYLGGQIRHTEIRSGVAAINAGGEANGAGEAEAEEDGD
ncbi:MAG: hypothetical protein IPM82_28835 [Saprospiraceae bacterium]|nr:hypothetical protein [Saprospiraceae bacterium]